MASSINELIRDEVLKRAILTDRLLRRHLNLVSLIFGAAFRDIDRAVIAGESVEAAEWTRAEVIAKTQAVRRIFDAAIIEAAGAIEVAAAESGQAALSFWNRQLYSSMPDFFQVEMGFGSVNPDSILAIGRGDALGLSPNSWSWKQRREFARLAQGELMAAQGFGESVAQAAKRLTSLNQPRGLGERLGRRSALDMTSNSFIRAAADVEEKFEAQNRDILAGSLFMATLDTRTCQVCGSLDGRLYKPGEPRPSIPVHNRCRCVYVPQTKTYAELGIDIDDMSPKFRASMDGPIEGGTTYDGWIRGLDDDRARDILGPGRHERWLDLGKPPLGDFVSGDRILRLDELV